MAADNNSFVRSDKKPSRPSIEERQKSMNQYIGVKQATRKENAWWTWFKDLFFSGRSLKEIAKEVATEQIAPQVKDNIRNGLVSMLDMGIYKDHKPTGVSSGTPSSFITNYVRYGDKQSAAEKLEENKKKEEDIIKSGYECPAFQRKVDAERFLNDMKAYVMKFTTMSVLDLAYMQGKRIAYTWDKYGWDQSEILEIEGPVHINNPEAPWIIELPKAGVLS